MRQITLLIFIVLLSGCLGDYSPQGLSHFDYHIRISGKEVAPTYVVDYKSDENYLTVSRVKRDVYDCSRNNGNSYSRQEISTKWEYRIIELDGDIVYVTEDRNLYVKALRRRGISNLITSNNIADALYMKKPAIKEMMLRNKQEIDQKVSTGECKLTYSK